MAAQNQKLNKLKAILQRMGSVLIAYSGGADSTLLLKVAAGVLPEDKILAVTAVSATYPREELNFAKKNSKALGVRHKIIKTGELNNKKFVSNPVNRCYFCKEELFRKLKNIAAENKLNFVVDASNVSDKTDFRPGSIAKKKLGVRSPLQEAGLIKDDVRLLSRELGLVTWDKPSSACLASRIPYGVKITQRILNRVDEAEKILRKMGFQQARLRHYNGLCRIEVLKKDIPALIAKRNSVVEKIKNLGYNYITVDLEGYRTGSLNEVIKR